MVKSIWKSTGFAEACTNVGNSPDIVFLNGCAVTEKAAAKSRQLARRLKRQFPDAILVAAGCMVQAEPERIAGLPEVDYTLGVVERYRTDWLDNSRPSNTTISVQDTGVLGIPECRLQLDRSRPFLKVQDGCDQYCSYSIIPLLRGGLRSVPIERVLNDARQLLEQGAREIVLTGVRIGTWGWDQFGGGRLYDLVNELLEIPIPFRIRLGSLEPWELDEKLVELVATDDRICPHLHIPLQHTSPTVLLRMNRPDLAKTVNLIRYAKSINPDIAIGTDIIAGFPGETDEEFNRLMKDLTDLPISYMHVFSFSSRPGTTASSFKGRLTPQETRLRADKINMVDKIKRSEYITSQIGKRRPAIPDNSGKKLPYVIAITDNYLKVRVDRREVVPGCPVIVRIEPDKNGNVTGVIDKSVI